MADHGRNVEFKYCALVGVNPLRSREERPPSIWRFLLKYDNGDQFPFYHYIFIWHHCRGDEIGKNY